MQDPRAENCRRFADANGKVVGVELEYLAVPSAKYELVKVSLVDEEAAQGQTIASVSVLDRDGLAAQERCYLAWPWSGWQFPAKFENTLLPGSANVPYQHVITNGYIPPAKGPLAIFIGDHDRNVQSDVITGLGLPANRHICFQLVFRERGTQILPPKTEDLASQLKRIEEKLDRLSSHFGLHE